MLRELSMNRCTPGSSLPQASPEAQHAGLVVDGQ